MWSPPAALPIQMAALCAKVRLRAAQLAAGSMVVEMAPKGHGSKVSDDDFLANVGEHPVIANYEQTHDGRPLAISDFLDEESFHRTRLYQSFYRLLGAEDQISFVLPETSLLIGIALNRDTRGFSERDRTLLNLVRPVLALAYRNSTAAERLDGSWRRSAPRPSDLETESSCSRVAGCRSSSESAPDTCCATGSACRMPPNSPRP